MTHAGKVVLELSNSVPELLERCLYELRKVGGEGGPGARIADALLEDAIDIDLERAGARAAASGSDDGVIRERLDQLPTDV